MSFYTSLSGLQASQTDLSVISHNIANVGTNGFKKSHAQFADVMASNFATDPTKQVGSGVVVKANRQEFKEGNYNNSANALDLAISGDGFFAVQNPGKGPLQYTRNGAFQVDQQNYVTDSSGGRLQVLPVDTDGNVTATGLDGLAALQLPATSGEPIATKKVTMDLNLSSTAATTPMAFNRSNLATYNNTTITKIYDPSGNAMTLTNYYVRKPLPVDANGNAIQPTDGSSTWQVYSFVDDQQLKVQGSADPVELTFDKVPAGLNRGQTIDIRITLGAASRAVVAPVGGWLEAGGSSAFVLDADGAHARRRSVKTGRRNPEQVEILSGLNPGERIVISNTASVKGDILNIR